MDKERTNTEILEYIQKNELINKENKKKYLLFTYLS